jgi:hypothetical protein
VVVKNLKQSLSLSLLCVSFTLFHYVHFVHTIHTLLIFIQLVRYKPGEFFGVHHDLGDLLEDGSVALPPRDTTFGSKRRLVTLFCYLNTLPSAPQDESHDEDTPTTTKCRSRNNGTICSGSSTSSSARTNSRNGATQFPAATNNNHNNINIGKESAATFHRHARNTRSQAALRNRQDQNQEPKVVEEEGLLIQPVQGRAVLFCNITPDGLPDARTIHAGLPPIIPPPPRLESAGGGGGFSKTKNKKKRRGKKNYDSSGDDQHHFEINKYGLNIWMCED